MNIFKTTALAVLFAFAGLGASASSLDPGTYNVVDIDRSVELGPRSIWTPNGNNGPTGDALVQGGSASAYWTFQDVVLDYNGTNGPSSLTGTATNTGDSNLSIDLSINLSTATAPGAQTGYCQFNGSGGACDASDPDDSMWAFMTILAGSTFSGTAGTELDGIVWDISDLSGGTHPPQVGVNANALVENDLQGISMWFSFVRSDHTQYGGNYTINSNGKGDINSNLSPVPLPAAGWLLIAGLGGLAAMRRRTH